MKKILISSMLLAIYFTGYTQDDQSEKILIAHNGNIDKRQNVIGLTLVEYTIINNSKEIIKLVEPERWTFSAQIDGQDYSFTQNELVFPDIHYIYLHPNDTFIYNLNLSFTNFKEQYFDRTDKILSAPTEVIFCVSLYSNDNGKRTPYSSKPDTIILYPLEKEDKMAFEYIQSKGFNPYYLTCGVIAIYNIDSTVLQTVISTYPTSTFAELANLSLAYSQAGNDKTDPVYKKEQVLQYLARPLTSKYTYVRYLAEALRKTQ